MWMIARNLGCLLAAAALTGGCGSGNTPAAAGAAAPPVVHKAARPADGRSRNMVNAVPETKEGPNPVQVKFQLRQRPDVSQPLDIDLVIVPVSGTVDRIAGKVEVEDGMELIDGGEIAAADRPVEGVDIPHAVKVLPKRDGIFTLTAVLSVDAAGQTIRQSFSIPVIAGAGMPDLPAPTRPAAGAAAR
jgi:hypothetical protein